MEVLKARADITSLIENISQEHGINKYTIADVKTNQKGEGYLGEIFMVTVKDVHSDKQMEMVIKAAFIDEKVRTMVPIRASFENEIYFYTNVYPVYQKFEKERGISPHIQLAPNCLKVSVEDQQEMLALENLRISGFEIFDKTRELDDAHIKLIFKTYGRFHAYSYVLRDQEPEKYEKMAGGLTNIYEQFMKNDFFAKHLLEINHLVRNTLIPGVDDEVIKKYEKYEGENISDIFGKIAVAEDDYFAILHGDCWSNNMMFKYEDSKTGRKPVDMRLIDWQIIKTGSPVCDLSYCLYSGGSKKVFDNLNEYLQIYYDSFSTFARQLGSDPEKLYPFAVLKQQWKKYARWGMIMSFSILKMKLTNKEDLIDLTDGFEMDDFIKEFQKSKYNEEDYNTRIRGLLLHMSEEDAL